MADQSGFSDAHGVQQGDDGGGGLFHALRRRAFAFAVAGQVNRQHVPAVVRQVTGLQNPHAVVVQHAVNEDRSGLRRVEGLAAGVGEELVLGQLNKHGVCRGSMIGDQAFSHAGNGFILVAQRLVKRQHGGVAGTHLQIDFGAT